VSPRIRLGSRPEFDTYFLYLCSFWEREFCCGPLPKICNNKKGVAQKSAIVAQNTAVAPKRTSFFLDFWWVVFGKPVAKCHVQRHCGVTRHQSKRKASEQFSHLEIDREQPGVAFSITSESTSNLDFRRRPRRERWGQGLGASRGEVHDFAPAPTPPESRCASTELHTFQFRHFRPPSPHGLLDVPLMEMSKLVGGVYEIALRKR